MWLYKEKKIKSIEEFPETAYGFVYMITNLKNGRIYIGRKCIRNVKNVKLGLKERAALSGVGRKPRKKRVVSESNWAEYYGSSVTLNEDIVKYGKDNFKREILRICYTKKQCSYYEIKYQFLHGVIENPETSYNQNVMGRYFKKDLLDPRP